EAKKPTTYDVVIFDNYKPTFLPDAGNFVWFNAVPDNIKTKVATDAPPGAKLPGNPVVLEDVGVLDWKREHPIMQGLGLGKLWAAKALKLVVPLDREVLLDGLKGPLIVLDRGGKSTHLIVGFDIMDTRWVFSPSFPVFMLQAMQYLAVGQSMDVRQALRPGEVVRVPRSVLQQVDPNLKKVTLVGPGGRQDAAVPPDGEFVLPKLERVGLYTTDPPLPGYEQLAVNVLDANESNLLPADKIPAAAPAAPGTDAEVTGKRRLELWWWLALIALGVLTVEWWVYTRRVHL
ncbi:MAG: hypothetical protein JWO31_2786, partial [Phycisphaerales bacterium]|nr:hypothetical protein [Phycisphaerales bacterium]